MTITEICVTAGRKFADPGEPGTTLCCNIHLKATVGGFEAPNPTASIRRLQGEAERMVEAHRDRLVSSLANRRSIQRVKDTLNDARDGADEQKGEVAMLESSLEQLENTPSIFNEQEGS